MKDLLKKKRSTSVLTNSFLYTAGNLLLKAFSFFLIPLYTAYLSTEEYGVINLASGFYAVLGTLITIGLQYAVVRFYADYKDDRTKVARMYGSVISLILMIGAAVLVIAIVGQQYVAKWFFKGMTFYPVVLLSVLIAVTSGLYTVYQEILKGMQEAGKSVILSYVYFFLHLGLNILLVVSLKKGATGVLIAGVGTYLVMILIMFIDLLRRKLLILCLDGTMLKALLRYSLPLVPHTLAFNLQTYATRLILNERFSLSLLGIYSLAAQFGMVADVVLNSVQSAFQPWVYGVLNKDEPDGKKRIAQMTYLLMWLYGLMFILIGLFSQEAVLIMAQNESYMTAWIYIPLIVVTTSLKAPMYFYLNLLYYDKKKTKYLFISTVVGCIINVLFTWILTPVLHIYGSIVADIIAIVIRQIMVLMVVFKQARELYSLIKLELLSLLPIPFLAAALIPVFLWNSNSISVKVIGIKLIVVLLYVGLMLLVNRKKIGVLLQRLKARKSGGGNPAQ